MRRRWCNLLAVSALALGGCTSPRVDLGTQWRRGEYGAVRERLAQGMTQDRGDRNFVLDRMRLTVAMLADGYAYEAEEPANDLFDLLRTQGLNADKTVPSVVLSDGVRVWKGEPFEQAMGYYYVALQKAMIGDWGNARAAAQSSLFLLRDFGENERGERLTTEEIARRAAERDRSSGAGGDEYLDRGYQPVATNFALGYFMVGVAAVGLGRREEAADNFRLAWELDAGLKPVAEAILEGRANAVVFAEFGLGPEKTAYGPDGALSEFRPRTMSDERGLWASVVGPSGERGEPAMQPIAADLNEMARDHLWNNMEDVRSAKSTIGSILLVGGGATAVASDHRETQLVGLAVLAVGALLKASSRADTRYADVLPQRVYVAALNVREPDSTLDLTVAAQPATRMLVPGVDAPRALEPVRVMYVRAPLSEMPVRWRASGRVEYLPDGFGEPVSGSDLPYVLGGRCVRAPSELTLAQYQAAGFLAGFTLTDLENLYREEGLVWRREDLVGPARVMERHVLEGGRSLVPPLEGTSGWVRLFCQEQRTYSPRSVWGKELFAETARLRAARSERTSNDRGSEESNTAADEGRTTSRSGS